VGFTSLLLLVPLAVTSTTGWIRRLGGKRWNRLHRLIYPATAAGLVHYLWLVKKDVSDPIYWGAALACVLALRLMRRPARQPRPLRLSQEEAAR
jgi:sulfoxide reductase heme-binding subunit YedZ